MPTSSRQDTVLPPVSASMSDSDHNALEQSAGEYYDEKAQRISNLIDEELKVSRRYTSVSLGRGQEVDHV